MEEYIPFVRDYFNPNVWNTLNSEDQKNFTRTYYIYINCQRLGIDVVKPVFMEPESQEEEDEDLEIRNALAQNYLLFYMNNQPAEEDKNNKTANNQSIKTFSCPKCKFVADKNYKLKVHLEDVHATGEQFICSVCKKYFKSKRYLDQHMTNIHKRNRLFRCSKCDFISKSCQTMTNHLLRHEGFNTYMCKVCKEKFPSPSVLQKHYKLHKDSDLVKQCPHCDKVFGNTCHYDIHVVSHTNEAKFICEVCGKACKTKAAYRHHKVTHNEDRAFSCSQCTKTFKTTMQLKRHVNGVHLKIRDHKCTFCDYVSSQSGALKTHMYRHMKDKPFKCHLCDYQGCTNAQLKQHIKNNH